MAQHIIKNRLINFSSFECESEQERNCHRQAYNSLMLKMSELDRYEQVQQFTQCEKQECKMVLTNQDKDYIEDWNWVESNEELYEDIKDKIDKMKLNKWNFYIWNCRFCGTKNLIEKDKAYFAKNKSKFVVKQGLQVDKIGKVAENPLTLFVIDSSSSMEQQLPDINELLKKNNKQLFNSFSTNSGKQLTSFINEKLKKTQIYQKITQSEKKSLNEVKKKIDPDSKTSYTDNLTKYKILMSMTQNAVNSICSSSKTGQLSKINIDNSIERKIGFMFFNSDIILQKIPKKNQTKVIKILNKQFESDKDNENQIKVNFQNFNELFQLGFNNSQGYGMSMDNFKFSDLDMNNISPSGQSALGPALVVATGIVSGYGSGSLIVVVTDGKANKGIFSQGGLYQEQLNVLKYKLTKARAETCLMKLQTKNQQEKSETQTVIQRYFRKNSSSLIVSLHEKHPLEELHRRLKSIIDKSISSKTWTNNIRIKCQNPNIKYNDKLVDRMKKRLFRQSQIQFISPEINEGKLNAFDYRHPFMTQVLVEYQNIATKQECKFMAYIIQKIIKYNEMNKKEEEQLNSVETLQNVMTYLDVEGEKLDMNKIPLTLCKQSFRSYVMQSYKHSVQQEFNKEVMKDMNEFIEKPIFKTPKEYIKSLVENNQDFEKI